MYLDKLEWGDELAPREKNLVGLYAGHELATYVLWQSLPLPTSSGEQVHFSIYKISGFRTCPRPNE